MKLKEALDELRAAFLSLQSRMERGLANEFGYGDQTLREYRHKITERAESLLVQITENKMKAFAFRLVDEGLSEADWLESLGSLLALRPPNKWKDIDEETFERELENLAGRFKRAESVTFGKRMSRSTKVGIRIAVTKSDGSERQEVIHLEPEEEKEMKKLQDQIAALIGNNARLGLAAASRAIWAQLKPENDI